MCTIEKEKKKKSLNFVVSFLFVLAKEKREKYNTNS